MYRQQYDDSTGGEHQYQFSANSSFNYSPFSGSMAAGIIDHSFQAAPQHLSPSIRPSVPRQPSHSRQSSNEWQGVPRQTGSLSPRYRQSTPVNNAGPSYSPADRSLPSPSVNADTIADAYAAFILYCNPNFDLDVDTTTLRTNFQSPPKSDNKDFETYRLFELIRKFDAKEIKTWGQLALDLGVEAPDVSKGQSVQKVQQYSVRLKRWMRAMHVDAFFEYLLGKQHSYSTEIPHPSDPYPSNGRDGVLAEEDLAIRALDPSFRPKRGRRRNSEVEAEEDADAGAASSQQQAMDDSSQAVPASAHPMSSVMQFNPEPQLGQDPWAAASAVTTQSMAPWMRKHLMPQTAITSTAPSHLRWQLHGNAQNPGTPHPMTALPTSMNAHIDAAFDGEPKSAITPSSRKRRKHGPAVSSAWPSTNAPGAKPRGRPPASRNTQDGPFTTFPADPANDKVVGSSYLTPMTAVDNRTADEMAQSLPAMPTAIMQGPGDNMARPSKLSLQVPVHTGGPIRLATPPRVMVTSETSGSERQPSIETEAHEPGVQTSIEPIAYEAPGFSFEALKRVLASDLLRAELIGRRGRLSGDEARRLAEAVLTRFNVPRADTSNVQDDLARLTAASWLGIGGQLNVPLGPATGQNKKITMTRFREDAQGYEEIVSATEDYNGQTRDLFDLTWTVSMGGCNGSFELKGLSMDNAVRQSEDSHDRIINGWVETAKQMGMPEDWVEARRRDFRDPNFGERRGIFKVNAGLAGENVDWKSKYQALEFGSRMAKGEFNRFRQRLIEQVLDVIV
jgi:hypothetical protein